MHTTAKRQLFGQYKRARAKHEQAVRNLRRFTKTGRRSPFKKWVRLVDKYWFQRQALYRQILNHETF